MTNILVPKLFGFAKKFCFAFSAHSFSVGETLQCKKEKEIIFFGKRLLACCTPISDFCQVQLHDSIWQLYIFISGRGSAISSALEGLLYLRNKETQQTKISFLRV